MTADDIYAKPVSIEDLRLFKALTPLSADLIKQLAEIEKLDVTGYSEQEVRSFVIDPIVRILGYKKGTDFSVDLGKRIEFSIRTGFRTTNSIYGRRISGSSRPNAPTWPKLTSDMRNLRRLSSTPFIRISMRRWSYSVTAVRSRSTIVKLASPNSSFTLTDNI
jgi:hypothetical protein